MIEKIRRIRSGSLMNLPNKQPNGSGRFYEYVIDNIRQMIADGELEAGQKLPSERELAENSTSAGSQSGKR